VKFATLQARDARMDGLLAYLRAHLNEPLQITSLAQLADVSPRQVDRLFVRLFGESLRACLRRLRLERAARQLRASRARILTIALEAGFDSHESFTRSFSRHFGHNPSAYRRLRVANLQPRDRIEYWRLAMAGGLRRHVEQPRFRPRTSPAKASRLSLSGS
jgi:transcriptional regulator GlxA family with amidase domain